jgi:coenzyme F420-reducing hydrogenase gamma subunit
VTKGPKPRLAVFKLASCDGCQLSLLDCEDELLAVVGAVDIVNFLEASRAVEKGPYDVVLVEGSITTPHDAERIHQIRRSARFLVTIGACATAGGIQALRNNRDVAEFTRAVYASPQFIETLNKSTPVVDHVFVDFELRGCPVSKTQLVEVLSAFLNRRKPVVPTWSVCLECKRRGTPCVMVAHGMRRALPLVRPRLLRLLRADGDPEHLGPRGGMDAPRRRQRRDRPGVPLLQRGRRAVPPGERDP